MGPDLDFNIRVNAKMTETMVAQRQGGADMRMRYMRYEIGVPTKLMSPNEGDRIKRMVQLIGIVHADLMIDDNNNLKKNTVDLGKSPNDARADLKDLHQQIQESLESLSVPLPGAWSSRVNPEVPNGP